jgi:hypothetical protein
LQKSISNYVNYILSGGMFVNTTGLIIRQGMDGWGEEQVSLTDWYEDEETGKQVWMPRSKNRKGYRRIGKYHRLKGANGNYIAHYENIVLGVGGLDQVNALILQHSSSEQP